MSRRLVGYDSDGEPLAAEVICLDCWRVLPEWRDVYGYAVAAECAHCDREPGEAGVDR